ncbi:leukocyte immunoglobulin-like receptor subfamily A member 6 [Suncus etruscus]|uniref:leukocyte immunoglobulin-like receptor subfamily A member 6 n=1 Tax=Suncus etruscus TaxID=109475 RepID=UPI0021101145|nr:leukocyte immunoglobulin-like receptor subfamily A member 6 [Suncus etruscus]
MSQDSLIPLTALLCLGELNVGTGTPLQAGILPRPTIWADPDSVIPLGSSLTLWCQGTPGAQKYFVYVLGYEGQLNANMIPVSGDKAKYTVTKMDEGSVGRFVCQYCKASGCSMHSNELMLMVTGFHKSSPSLSVLPSSVVPLGQYVTLKCGSPEQFQGFILIREGKPKLTLSQKSHQHPNGQFQALFRVGPREAPDKSGRPSLLSPQGRIVTPGQNLTLQCRSQIAYDTFALSKEGTAGRLLQDPIHDTQARLFQANFTLSPVSVFLGGRYYCYGGHSLTTLWSEPSDPLDILVAGRLPYTPELSVKPGHLVSLGTNITMICVTNNWMDTFLLTKEGLASPLAQVTVDKKYEITEYLFFFYPVTFESSGSYRCYSAHSDNIFSLSYASAPLQLQVSDISISISRSNTGWGLHITDKINSQNICGLHRKENSSPSRGL